MINIVMIKKNASEDRKRTTRSEPPPENFASRLNRKTRFSKLSSLVSRFLSKNKINNNKKKVIEYKRVIFFHEYNNVIIKIN